MSETLIESLMKSSSLEGMVSQRQLVETHISWVLLAGDFAYKIKKPVNLGFLDFSTLEKRRHYCEEEVRLNRRLAADYYLGVVSVTREESGWHLEGSGQVVEYAVKMRRFDPAGQLDALLAGGDLKGHHMDAFADLLADFHMHTAAVSRDRGGAEQVCSPVRDNFSHIIRLREDSLPAGFRQLEKWSARCCESNQLFLESRRDQGWIRECHGDLHLCNMAWTKTGPLVFDCIEFNPDLRWIDVMSETAFLIMDLHARGEARLAWRFLNRYLEHTGDYQGLRLLPFYLVYRAMVRAKVAAIRASQLGEGEERIPADLDVARYLELARGFSRPGRPQLVITHGLSGSGKSRFSARLAERGGFLRIRSDVERKRLFGLGARESAQAAPGSGIYTARAGEIVYERLKQLTAAVLDAGFSVIVDAAFLQEQQRTIFMDLAREKGLVFTVMELQASAEILRQRVASRKNDVSDADLTILEHQLATSKGLSDREQNHVLTVNTEVSPDWNVILSFLARE
jgi:aminoglycoside phosphotransferase family enzyme/gluconate kinase